VQIYLIDLEAQDKGHLVGEWVELPISEDKLDEIIRDILSKGQKICNSNFKHEQVLISDYKADFEIEVYDNVYILNEIAKSFYDLLKFRFLIFQGFLEKDILLNGLDFYDVEICDFRNSDDKTISKKLKADYTEFQKGIFGRMGG
jgi:hypothetical protein